MTVRLAVTLGDPRGIGPEIVAKALAVPLDAELTILGADDQFGAVAAAHHVPVGRWAGEGGARRAGTIRTLSSFCRASKSCVPNSRSSL